MNIVSEIRNVDGPAVVAAPLPLGNLNTPTNALLADSFAQAASRFAQIDGGKHLPSTSKVVVAAGHGNRLAVEFGSDHAGAVEAVTKSWYDEVCAILAVAPDAERVVAAEYLALLVREWQQALTLRSTFIRHMEMLSRPYKLYSPRVDLANPATWVPAYVQFSTEFFRLYSDHDYWWDR